jgi:hypothetical protein
VAGGLGNQLFMLGAAWEQAARLGCPLYLEASSFTVNKLYGYGLGPLDLPAVRLSSDQSPWRTVRVGGRFVPVPRRYPGRIYREQSVQHFSPKIFEVRPGTTLLGYFQSPRYFPAVRHALLDRLWNVAETGDEKTIIRDFQGRPAITLHLRRGDYLQGPADRVFLATVDYARRAIALLRQVGCDQHVRVFTDSVDMVRTELGGTAGDLEYVESETPLGTKLELQLVGRGPHAQPPGRGCARDRPPPLDRLRGVPGGPARA